MPGCRQHDLEARVAGFDLVGEGRDLVQRIGKAVACSPPRRDQHDRAARDDEIQDLADLLDAGALDRAVDRVDEDHRVEDDDHDRRGDPADEAAEPGGEDGRRHEQDVAGLATDGLVEAGLERDRAPADEQAREHRLPDAEPNVARAGELPFGSSGCASRGPGRFIRHALAPPWHQVSVTDEVWTTFAGRGRRGRLNAADTADAA